jgi:hypothetical protein
MTRESYSVVRAGRRWVVIERTAGTVSVGGPFESRAYARQVAAGARIMAERRARKAAK